ncbi:two-component system sensor histidine kinase CreC [Moraxella oblonga]|uniref:two-component system sensor histidine kinase CreC n=1 Tax=Moraxella oblonga TaxID=200413 RepID=UPI000836FF0E|nr:two-component system sensor histidine kinase CreC [Moraxella oblonga]
MLNFHRLLDYIFKKRLSFSIFVRIWLIFSLITFLSSGLALYYIQKTLRPSAKRVVEDSLVDTSRLLAVLVANDVANLQKDKLNQYLTTKLAHAFTDPNEPLWYHQKQKSTYHLYITNDVGVVIYDSREQSVGADFSRWNDVYLTLQGKYGARSTDIDGHSVMYVASPIMAKGELIGVLSVGKPTQTLIPYIDKNADEIIKILLTIMGVTLAIATLMAWWLRHSIDSVNRYTKGLAKTTPPHFYLGRELNELMVSIHTMKNIIENKAYVSEYVHTLTHELKSPLTAIRASAEILTNDLTDGEREQFTTLILAQTDKLTDLVDKLLALAKLEQPNFKLSLQKIAIDEVIQTCLNQQSAYIKQLNKNIHINASGIKIVADEFWLTQALQNIIDNALYYGKDLIHINISQTDKNVIINISNDSDVLDDFVIERAFERYFSVGNGTQKSTGLGLTLVKQVIELHGGVVSMGQGDKDGRHMVSVVVSLPY